MVPENKLVAPMLKSLQLYLDCTVLYQSHWKNDSIYLDLDIKEELPKLKEVEFVGVLRKNKQLRL
jgi:hypothetical protein